LLYCICFPYVLPAGFTMFLLFDFFVYCGIHYNLLCRKSFFSFP
jgi:hypothetical protein